MACDEESVTKQLNVEEAYESNASVVLKWTNPNISGFSHYQIMRAYSGGGYSVINDINDKTSDAYAQSVTTYTDNSYPLVDSVYYKIIAIGDEVISSENICVKVSKPVIFSNQIYKMASISGTDNVVATYYDNGYKLGVIDMDTKSVETEISISYPSSDDCLSTGVYNGNKELYYWSGHTDKLYIYDASTLENIRTTSGYYYFSYPEIVNDANGNIYVFISGSSYFYSYNRTTDSFTQTYTYQYNYGMRYDSVSNTLGMLGASSIITYDLSSDGTATKSKTQTVTESSSNSYIDGTNLVYQQNTTNTNIYNPNSGEQNSLNNTINFSKIYYKNGYFYCTFGTNIIYCYNADTYEFVKKISIRIYVTELYFSNSYLYYTGSYNGYYIIDRQSLLN